MYLFRNERYETAEMMGFVSNLEWKSVGYGKKDGKDECMRFQGRLRGVAALLLSCAALLIAALLPAGVGLSAPASFGALMLSLLSLLLGLVAVTALSNISAGLVLVTLDNRGVNAVITFLILFLCGNILPLTLFPDRWQRFIQWQPFAQILDAPIRLYTGEYALRGFPQIALMQVFWIVLLVLIGRMLWRHTLRRIVIQGG